jgi:hypothetical protein
MIDKMNGDYSLRSGEDQLKPPDGKLIDPYYLKLENADSSFFKSV